MNEVINQPFNFNGRSDDGRDGGEDRRDDGERRKKMIEKN
jgi:hypothetical protein